MQGPLFFLISVGMNYDPVYFKVSNPMGQEELYSYDGNERLQQKINKDGSTINYIYYKVGWLKEITSASRFTRFTRDNDGLPTKIESTDATVNQSIVWERFWDELGRPETDLLSNGMRVERSFDAAERLTYLSHDFGGEPNLKI